MKKILLASLFILSYVVSFAQWTPEETIPVWSKRYVPPRDEVDSTFSSICFKTEKDSFSYADVMNFSNVSSTYGSADIDTMTVTVLPVKDGSASTYIAAKMLAGDNTGYPGYGATQNVITVNPAVNSSYDPTDTLTIELRFDMFTPAGSTGCDSLKVVIYSNTKSDAGSVSTTVLAFDGSGDWQENKKATLTITNPQVLDQQTILVVIEPKFGAKNDTASIANVAAKIYNTNPE